MWHVNGFAVQTFPMSVLVSIMIFYSYCDAFLINNIMFVNYSMVVKKDMVL